MSNEQKRKELEAAGYELGIHNDGIVSSWTVELPDGTVLIKRFFFSDFDRANVESVVVSDAYEHLQRDTKLKALEAFVWDMWRTAKRMSGTEPSLTIFTKADNLIEQFNITADKESESE